IFDDMGQPLYLLGISEDVTERKALEDTRRHYAESQERYARELEAKNLALLNSEALYHSLVENLPQSIFRKDRKGRFTFANSRFCELAGHSLEEMLGKTDHDLYAPKYADKYRGDDERVMETGLIWEQVEENPGPDGRKCYVQVIKTPIYDAQGAVLGIQGI